MSGVEILPLTVRKSSKRNVVADEAVDACVVQSVCPLPCVERFQKVAGGVTKEPELLDAFETIFNNCIQSMIQQ